MKTLISKFVLFDLLVQFNAFCFSALLFHTLFDFAISFLTL